MSVALALGMLFQDLIHAHLLGEVERHELSFRILAKVSERRSHARDVVHADGHLTPVPAQTPVQVLLKAHERLNGLAGKGQTTDHSASNEWAHRLYRLIHLQDDRALLNGVLHKSRFEAQEALHSPGNALYAV